MKKTSALLVLSVISVAANAQISPIGEFAGALTEGFEGFDNYRVNPATYFANSADVFGGAATLAQAADAVVYEPGSPEGAEFGLFGKGDAQVHGGARGFGVNANVGSNPAFPVSAVSITFDSPIGSFGGYFNYPADASNPLTFRFFGEDGAQIGSDQQATVPITQIPLQFVGFSSTVGIRRVVVSGDFFVADDLQASPVPEPASLAVLSMGALALLRRRSRRE